jgi:hypothetical protein
VAAEAESIHELADPKRCADCGQVREGSEFGWRRISGTGYRNSYCRECMRRRSNERYAGQRAAEGREYRPLADRRAGLRAFILGLDDPGSWTHNAIAAACGRSDGGQIPGVCAEFYPGGCPHFSWAARRDRIREFMLALDDPASRTHNAISVECGLPGARIIHELCAEVYGDGCPHKAYRHRKPRRG